MARQGRFFSEYEIRTILGLLRTTDMSIPSIAQRMQCSTSAIAAINRKYQIREYNGQRTRWQVESQVVYS
jgi:hypothetical protein